MKVFNVLLTALMGLVSVPALAHVGPEAMEQHFIEHLLIVTAVALPVGYGVVRWLAGSRS
ncbi:MAG: hypothetical protein B0D96_00720 [Candidatus Sedimenticola endophacoides]|nr:MAG: hypothetical protein B0D94_01405 [Candidatus Sedimenticola endophacoides]OQX38176.1 MAG: hypothetical protein B0D96_00720 [Candidatus Sedimenticola endophacoides]OQX45227.1 MAG: hypothetical protein B0D86_04020 [Candidatus Sedimenticola endophacoides]OQX48912.1 MAG: hypothetical protein B0D87_03185 [Candidatus Sedimenticola endophacoides]